MASLHLQVQGWILRAGLDQMTQIPQVSDGSISRWNCDQGKAKSQNILPESSQGKVMRSEDINIRTRSKTWTGDRESAGSASPEMSKGQTGILEGEGCHATQRLHSPPPYLTVSYSVWRCPGLCFISQKPTRWLIWDAQLAGGSTNFLTHFALPKTTSSACIIFSSKLCNFS